MKKTECETIFRGLPNLRGLCPHRPPLATGLELYDYYHFKVYL